MNENYFSKVYFAKVLKFEIFFFDKENKGNDVEARSEDQSITPGYKRMCTNI